MPLPQRNTSVVGVDAPGLYWCSGLIALDLDGKGRFKKGDVGWYIPAGRHEALDDACKAAKIARISIRHGSGDTSLNWWLGEDVSVFPLEGGPVASSIRAINQAGIAERSAEQGIGMRWPKGTDQYGKPFKSKAAVRVYVADLVAAGYLETVQMTATSTMSDALLRALIDHNRVVEAAEKILDRAIFPVELSLPLGTGPEVTVGKEASSTTLVEFASAHPKAIDAGYIKGRLCPETVLTAADAAWDSVVAWATAYNRRDPGEEPAGNGAGSANGHTDEVQVSAEDMEAAIASCRDYNALTALQGRVVDLRNAREIDMAEQMRLSQLIDARMEEFATPPI